MKKNVRFISAFFAMVFFVMTNACHAQINDEHLKRLPPSPQSFGTIAQHHERFLEPHSFVGELHYQTTAEQRKEFMGLIDSAEPKTWEEWKLVAEFYLVFDETDKAISATKYALKLKPDAYLYLLLGIETRSNDKKTAEDAFRKAYATDNTMLFYYIEYLVDEKRYMLAKNLSDKFPKNDTDFQDNLLKAEAYVLAGDTHSIISDLMVLSRRNRSFESPSFVLPIVAVIIGDTLVQRREYDLAIQLYGLVEKSVDTGSIHIIADEVQEALDGTILALDDLKDYNGEVGSLREYVGKHDTIVSAFMYYDKYHVQKYEMTLARLLLRLKQYGDALEIIDHQLARRTQYDNYGDVSNAEILCIRGVVLRDMGRRDDALEQFHSAIKSDLNYSPAYFELGYTCISQGWWSDARDAYLRVVDIDSSNDAAWNNLGLAYTSLGNKIDAIRCMRKAVALAPSDDQEHETLGSDLLDIGDIEGAEQEVEVLRKLSSERAFVLEAKIKALNKK